MAILTSTIIEERPQPDGRRYITERHTRDDGPDYVVGPYLAEAGDDVSARMLARRTGIVAQLIAEAAARIREAQVASIRAKLEVYCITRTDVVLLAAAGADLTGPELAVFRAGL